MCLCKIKKPLIGDDDNENKKAALILERRYDLGSTSWYSHTLFNVVPSIITDFSCVLTLIGRKFRRMSANSEKMKGRFRYLCPKAQLWDIDSEIGKTLTCA